MLSGAFHPFRQPTVREPKTGSPPLVKENNSVAFEGSLDGFRHAKRCISIKGLKLADRSLANASGLCQIRLANVEHKPSRPEKLGMNMHAPTELGLQDALENAVRTAIGRPFEFRELSGRQSSAIDGIEKEQKTSPDLSLTKMPRLKNAKIHSEVHAVSNKTAVSSKSTKSETNGGSSQAATRRVR